MDDEHLKEALSGDKKLKFSDLRGADLEGADLNGADLEGSNFGDANLQGASLQGANLRGVQFAGANLENANLSNTDLRDVEWSDDDGNSTEEPFYLAGADLSNADLRNANLEEVELENANLQGANLDGATFRASYIYNVNFKNATGKVYFSNEDGEGNLDEPDLTTLDTSNLDLSDEYLRGAILNSSQERQRKENWDAMIKREEKINEEDNERRRNDVANAHYNKNWDELTDKEQESLEFEDIGIVCHNCGYSYLDGECPECGV